VETAMKQAGKKLKGKFLKITMSKPKIKVKKKINIPSNIGSIEISFREVKRKRSIKGAKKINIPKAAEQVVIKAKRKKQQSKNKSL
jgi:hypothetical protein